MDKNELIEVFEDTCEQIKNIKTEPLTSKYTFDNVLPFSVKDENKTQIEVLPLDTISAALSVSNDESVCILNMASEKKSGGGVRNGAKAQEECLYRCTNLIDAIPNEHYPLNINECLYTINATIIKDKNYNLIKTPRIIDCITIPAININKYRLLVDNYLNNTKSKIFMMLKLAHDNNIKNIILGAWGCGVFGNNPKLISKLFLEIINDNNFKFNRIIFAVINDHNSVDNNYQIFKNNLTK